MAKLSFQDFKEIISSDNNTEYDDREIKRGEIYFIDLDNIGYISKHILAKTRPALVIQNDVGNARGQTVIVALLTTTNKKPYPFQYHITLNNRESVILFEQIMSIEKGRIMDKIGELTYQQMKEAEEKLMFSLQLNRFSLENVQDIEINSIITKKTKFEETIYFEIEIKFAYNQTKIINIKLENLKKFNKNITKDIDFIELKNMLDCCKGLNWLVNNNEIV